MKMTTTRPAGVAMPNPNSWQRELVTFYGDLYAVRLVTGAVAAGVSAGACPPILYEVFQRASSHEEFKCCLLVGHSCFWMQELMALFTEAQNWLHEHAQEEHYGKPKVVGNYYGFKMKHP